MSRTYLDSCREGNAPLLARYDRFFAGKRLDLLDVTAAVVERATELRARHGFRTPDAIHLATAMEDPVDSLLTGDAAFSRCAGLRVEVVS